MKPKGVTAIFLDIMGSLIPPVLFQEDRGKVSYEEPRPLSFAGLRTGSILISAESFAEKPEDSAKTAA